MTRLGLRLTLAGGREAAARLIITALAVAIGVGLLLIALSGMHALNVQNARTAWLNSGEPFGVGPEASASDPMWWLFSRDHFGNQAIDRVDVAATGAASPVPPGIPHLPGPGQYYASPALSRLLRSIPAAELADRFGGQQIGTLGSSALPSPDSLIIVVGRSVPDLSAQPGASQVTAINTDTRLAGANGWDANKLQTVLAVGALALLFPVLIFIATATRLSAARREQRFAAMRLVGATPRQVSTISAVEAAVAAVGGVVIGFGVFFVLRPVLTKVPFTGAPFAPGDLSLSLTDILLVAVGVPLAAVGAARVAMRRVRISPLGVSRQVTAPAPRAYRLLPLVAGVAELAYFVKVGRPGSTGGQIEAYFSGCVLMLVGLVVAGPWLTMVGSRHLARRTGRPSVLIAGRRLSDNPRSSFRSISGLVVALFATSVSVGVITTISAYNGSSISGSDASRTLVERLGSSFGPFPSTPGQPATTPPVPRAVVDQLQSVPGVDAVTLIHSSSTSPPADPTAPEPLLATCTELARTPALGRCAPGAQVASLNGNFDANAPTGKSKLAQTVWPTAPVASQAVQDLPVRAIILATRGSHSAIERARTALETAFPLQPAPSTESEINANSQRSVSELQQLTKVVIAISLVVAGCSLAVSVTAGINDRKRPFSLLRLSGVPLRALHRVVALEAAVPLLVIAVPSAAMGFLAAALFLNSQLGESLRPPGSDYYLLVAAGLVASLAIIASTLPVIDRITGPEIARNE